jgi:tellurite resistance protein
MLGLIIFGTRGVTYTAEQGQFYCPGCDARHAYLHKRCRRFFTLYFIPVIPLDLIGEYIECQRCTNTYKLSVLSFDPQAAQHREEAEVRQAMRRMLVMMSLADGRVDPAEIDAIATILGKIEDREVPRTEIEQDIPRARLANITIEQYCKQIAGYLNDSGRELVIKAAIMVAAADGNIDDSEWAALAKMASALNLSRAHFSGLISELTEDRVHQAAS